MPTLATGRVRNHAERVATVGTGLPARLAVRLLARALRRDPYREAQRVVRVLCHARDPQAAEAARAALERAWDGGARARSGVWHGVEEVARRRPARRYDLPYPVTAFLLAPAHGARYRPPVRAVAALAVPYRGYDAIASRLDPPAIRDAGPLLQTALESDDPRSRAALYDLLVSTDHPGLLDALEDAFLEALAEPGQHRLWRGGGTPRPLLRMALENPHLDRPPRRGHGGSAGPIDDLAVLALLRGRPDALPSFQAYTVVRQLLRYAGPGATAALRSVCRPALHALPRGALRDELCREAMSGDAEARAIVVDAGHLPRDAARVPLFLFCTLQWERFDDHDPGGEKLRRQCRRYSDRDWVNLRRAAAASGRRPPDPPPPPPPRRSRRSPDTPRPGGDRRGGIAGSGRYTDGGGFGDAGGHGGYGGGFGI